MKIKPNTECQRLVLSSKVRSTKFIVIPLLFTKRLSLLGRPVKRKCFRRIPGKGKTVNTSGEVEIGEVLGRAHILYIGKGKMYHPVGIRRFCCQRIIR